MAKRRKKSAGGLPAKGRLRDMADSLWSLAVRADWGNRCAACGAGKCEAHHLVPRQHEGTRYKLECGIALCAHCHQFDSKISPHQNAAGFIHWLGFNYPARSLWLREHCWPEFNGTKNVQHYLDVLRQLRQYVEPEEFERVVGVKLARLLEETE
uniref:Uncharacterized protein n=1 Tax=viral metagenome TaxID=1070528 RepID=A0A6M3JMM2_9ZZZZ